jgi:hypothetical protein
MAPEPGVVSLRFYPKRAKTSLLALSVAISLIMGINRSSSPTWTFGYAMLWGGLSAVMPFAMLREYPSVQAAILTSVLGIAVVGLGYGVYRRSKLAAWILVVFALFDMLSRLVQGHSGYLMPGILFAFALTAAISMRRQTQISPIAKLRV